MYRDNHLLPSESEHIKHQLFGAFISWDWSPAVAVENARASTRTLCR